ncbi:DUF4355 domain-containing protein [Halalkalibacter sp. APA_J-10(15)]|uniref:DUF4355 domain-containing protein n=1 Tax=Halalkalibacter sp. APA_J-10(15) TaxID=2933805 RepID=UPI001FF14C40|nr:DUF4355 domain-containing protein [Halalkalibacter sp. APA_J-10(15)]MCK0473782.1 DUF4355 domain-containing protein [Halalkalibacter sp. APA_J-10(15)]
MNVSFKNQHPMIMHLQRFATDSDANVSRKREKWQCTLPKTIEEYRKALQSEGDKRVTMALQTAKAKWEEEYKQKLYKERSEAIQAAQVSVEAREKAIREKAEKDMAALEKVLNQTELKLKTIYLLNERKLPITFVDFLLDQNVKKIERHIDQFQIAFNRAVEEAVKESHVTQRREEGA